MANKPASEPAPDLPLEVIGKQLVPATEEEKERERERFGEGDGPVERNLLTHLYLRKDPWGWAREISLFVSGRGWRGYEGVIGQPSFFPGYNERVKTAVLNSTILEKKLNELADRRVATEQSQGLVTTNARERREELIKSLREAVDLMTEQMMCKMDSRPFIRGSYYMVTQLLTRAYHQGRTSANDALDFDGLTFIQAFMSIERKSFDFERRQNEPPKRTSPLSSYLATKLISITLLCK